MIGKTFPEMIGIFGGGTGIIIMERNFWRGSDTFLGWHSQHSRQKLLAFTNTKG
jgi:hypothetical protein